jgi:hypothetical protein
MSRREPTVGREELGMSTRKQAGGVLPVVLLILLVVSVVGGWNYYRNYTIEKVEAEAPRPFKSYSDEDLAQLAEAYQAEISEWMRRYEGAQGRRIDVRDTGSVGGNVEQYEEARKVGTRLRGLTTEAAQRQSRLKEINAEQERRATLVSGMAVHVQRLTKL